MGAPESSKLGDNIPQKGAMPKAPKLTALQDLQNLEGPVKEQDGPSEHQEKRATVVDPKSLSDTLEISDELKAKIYSDNPFVVDEALIEVFNIFDIDESMEIDTAELGEILKKLGMNIGKPVVEAILTDIDKDESGSIDQDEFVEFFRQIKDTEQLQKVAQTAKARKNTLSAISGGYLFMTLIAIFVLVLFQENSNDPVVRIGLWIAVSAFSAGIFYIIVLPILIIKLQPADKWEQLKEWYKKRREKNRWEGRTRERQVSPEHEVERFEPPVGSSGSYRQRAGDYIPPPSLQQGLRAIADARNREMNASNALAIPDARRASKQSGQSGPRQGSKRPSLKRQHKTSEDKEEGGLMHFEDDPNEIKPLYRPEHYDACLDLEARDAAYRAQDRAAESAESIEGGIHSHFRSTPTSHVSPLYNKAKLQAPVLAPWGDQRRWRKPTKK